MEAYSQVHAPQELTEEQVWEEVETWVNSLLEEGYDLSDYTWEEMYEEYIEEQGGRSGRGTGGGAEATSREVGAINRALGSAASAVGQSLQRANTVPSARPAGARQNLRGGGSRPVTSAKPPMPGLPASARQVTQYPAGVPTGVGGGNAGASRPDARPAAPAAKPASRPAAATPASRPAAKPVAAAKPTAPAKPAGSAMDQWAKANPKLAAAKAERDRTRGTSATTNPLMKDMKSKLPEPKPAPTLAGTVAAASKPTAFNPSSSSSSTAAAKPTAPKPTPRQQRLNMDIDLFDLVKGYLLDEGYAETEESAIVMMVNMSEGWRESILESCGVQLDELSHDTYRAAAKERNKRVGEDQLAGRHDDADAGQEKLDRTKRLRAKAKKTSVDEEVEQLDEISLKTKMKAYAATQDPEADYQYGSKVHAQGDRIKKAIVKKHGEKAGENADAHADSEHWGRKDKRTGKRQDYAKSRIEKNRTYRTTKAGKMHGQDQAKLKSDLKYNRSSRNEELELWVEELIAEGYDLSNYTWEEVAEIYAQELELAEAQSARENPEDHDKEEKKKYEKVRGERTPMPPRGDKRREDFEKWYAANVR